MNELAGQVWVTDTPRMNPVQWSGMTSTCRARGGSDCGSSLAGRTTSSNNLKRKCKDRPPPAPLLTDPPASSPAAAKRAAPPPKPSPAKQPRNTRAAVAAAVVPAAQQLAQLEARLGVTMQPGATPVLRVQNIEAYLEVTAGGGLPTRVGALIAAADAQGW